MRRQKWPKESQPTSAAGDGDGAGAAAFAWSFDGADDQMWLPFVSPLPPPFLAPFIVLCVFLWHLQSIIVVS